ncbi:MAG: hypothetical protein J6L61_03105 [Ruminiclostridium sp.]|nr:hypothetical protein [Ruminiclostridium sp.]
MKKILKISVFAAVVICLSAFFLIGCQNNKNLVATVNGTDITEEQLQEQLNTNAVFKEAIRSHIDDITTPDNKEITLKRLDEQYPEDRDKAIRKMVETAYFLSMDNSISKEEAEKQLKQQLDNLDTYSGQYGSVQVNREIMDECLKKLSITEEQYIKESADSYIAMVNRQRMYNKFLEDENITVDENNVYEVGDKFEQYIDEQLKKADIVYYNK